MNREGALKKAMAVVTDREKRYGDPRLHWAKVGRVWSEIAGIKIPGRKACLMMGALKIIRDCQTVDDENIVDYLGYGAIATEVENPTQVPVHVVSITEPKRTKRAYRHRKGYRANGHGTAATIRKAVQEALNSVPGKSLRSSDLFSMVYTWLRIHGPQVINQYKGSRTNLYRRFDGSFRRSKIGSRMVRKEVKDGVVWYFLKDDWIRKMDRETVPVASESSDNVLTA